jgi:thiamine kinase-like enzyme
MTTPFDLQQHLASYFRSEAGRFQLNAGSLSLDRVLNWGGFGSVSYCVGDGERWIHVKLATDQIEMRRWLAVHDRLENDYHAPKVLGWVELPGTPYGGLVFEHIDGKTWDTAVHPGLLPDLWSLLVRLHADRRLAQELGDGARSYRNCWEMRYREQFEEDLKTVRVSRPESITDARLSWMEQEAREVLALADGNDAFEGTSLSPCHWDLWPNNVQFEGTGRWWVLDWDSLAVGDEAEDLATLAWPFVFSQGKNWRDLIGEQRDARFATRMDLHLRAISLDYLIDVLADWAECDVPEWREEVQKRKESEHQQYFDWYRSGWG